MSRTPREVAGELNISVRHLHDLCVEHGLRRIAKDPRSQRKTYLVPRETENALRRLVESAE